MPVPCTLASSVNVVGTTNEIAVAYASGTYTVALASDAKLGLVDHDGTPNTTEGVISFANHRLYVGNGSIAVPFGPATSSAGPVHYAATLASNQTISDNVVSTATNLTSEYVDTLAAGSAGVYTIPSGYGGAWDIIWVGYFTVGHATAFSRVKITSGGSSPYGSRSFDAAVNSSSGNYATVSLPGYQLAVGDTVTFQAYQNSGSSKILGITQTFAYMRYRGL